MEDSQTATKESSLKKKSQYFPIRLAKREAKSRFVEQLRKVNKKHFGRKISADELLLKALSLLKDEHLRELQEITLTNEQRVALKFHEYQKKNPKASKEDFYGEIHAKIMDL